MIDGPVVCRTQSDEIIGPCGGSLSDNLAAPERPLGSVFLSRCRPRWLDESTSPACDRVFMPPARTESGKPREARMDPSARACREADHANHGFREAET
jgi:hypothetical protein